jgi:leucyl aminopeptidase
MGLHLAVGQGALHGPRMIHLKYRPKKTSSSKLASSKSAASKSVGGKSNSKPIAFVGKGITFDSGGLDIKPSSGMRLMKKDMGGAAAVLGVALWAELSQINLDLDFYIGLAENAVDQKSFRPSDVVTARNGMSVEIHNTDAEGRLVLADLLDVAVTKAGVDEPEIVIDVATLTGAIKVALGADLAGLFSNSDQLSDEIQSAGQKAGDLNWRMPLYLKYTHGMSSSFADIVNAIDGFGGAITAALFLEKFVRNKPWAHLDIYAWNDKNSGSLSFSGGNGQAVQCLVQFLKSKIKA